MRLWGIILIASIAIPTATWASDPSDTSTVLLVWTTPGDDGRWGTAKRYDLRYSPNPITSSNFSSATPVSFVPTPGLGGSMTQVLVTGLTPGVGYYFALKTADEKPNWSPLSNVVFWDGRTTAVHGLRPPVEMSQPYPNPARGLTHFTLQLPLADEVQIELYDVTGRRVRILVEGELGAGLREYTWNFRDDVGRRLGPGVYLMRAQVGGESFTRRIVAVE